MKHKWLAGLLAIAVLGAMGGCSGTEDSSSKKEKTSSATESSIVGESSETEVPTEEQTEAIFDTSSFISKSDDIIKLDDLTEAKNHFKLFDYMLDNVDKPLSKEMMIEMNKILKRNTSDEDDPRYNRTCKHH